MYPTDDANSIYPHQKTMPYTYHYEQPHEYHFSLDSIQLAKFVATQFESHPQLGSLKILDLCAGCGVIGFELSWHLQSIRYIDFIEVQDRYTEYFFQNRANINRPDCHFNWHLLNYDELCKKNWEAQYDLIISNPPYFHPDHGVLSPSEFKNRCRFYIDSSFENYIKALDNSLANHGRAYFLLRSLNHHGLDLLSNIKEILQTTTIKKVSNIRGTDIMLLEKLMPDGL